MTTENIESKEVIPETPEEIAAAEQEAEDGFVAGFGGVQGEPTSDDDDKSKDAEKEAEALAAKEAEVEAEAKADLDAKAAEESAAKAEEENQKFMDGLPNRLRGLEGHIGGLLSKIDSLATAKAAGKEEKELPTSKEIKAALSNPEAMDELVKEYEDFEVIRDELMSIRAELGKDNSVDIEQLEVGMNTRIKQAQQEGRELNKLDSIHPDWEATINTADFQYWSLDGGPPPQHYLQMKSLEQTDPVKAGQMIDYWAREFPQWWADRGANIFSPKATDSIALLNKYEEQQRPVKTEDDKEAARLKKEKRLAGAIPVTGSGGITTTGVSDEEAFIRGHKHASGT